MFPPAGARLNIFLKRPCIILLGCLLLGDREWGNSRDLGVHEPIATFCLLEHEIPGQEQCCVEYHQSEWGIW